ncbi:TonB-dependent receptor [candidate division KSB1 bacterium]|nr:TonB-dependent receptor [candidate division KSB1 bacterium]
MKPKLFIYILILTISGLPVGLYSERPHADSISVCFQSSPLRTVLKELSATYRLNFIYDDSLVDNVTITCQAQNKSTDHVLSMLLQPFNFTHEFVTPNTIIIRCAKKLTWNKQIISGNVRDAKTNEPLIYANAFIPGQNIGTITDLNGNFQFAIPDSTRQLVVSFMGYETEIRKVAPQSNTLHIQLRPHIMAFNPIHVFASPIAEEIEFISRNQLKEEPFIGVIGDMANQMSYASFMHYNSNDIYFSGDGDNQTFSVKITGNRLHPMLGTDRNNRMAYNQHHVMLNGFQLQMPFHATIIPAMNPGIINYDVIQKCASHTSVFDVTCDDAFESILDVSYRPGNAERVRGKIMSDLFNTNYLIEGPLTSRASWLVTGKQSHVNEFLNSIDKHKWSSLTYYDVQAQVDYQLTETQRIRLNYLRSDDNINFDPRMNYSRERLLINPNSLGSISNQSIVAFDNVQEINSDNSAFNFQAISLNASNQISDKLHYELSLIYSDQNYMNDSQWSLVSRTSIPELTTQTYNYEYREGESSQFNIRGLEEKLILYYESSPAYHAKAGVHYEQLHYNLLMNTNLYTCVMNNVSRPSHYNKSMENALLVNNYSWFLQEERTLFTNLQTQAGVRVDFFGLLNDHVINPRLKLAYIFPHAWQAKAAFGTFSRLPNFSEMKQCLAIQVQPGYKPRNARIDIQSVDKYEIGIEKQLGVYLNLGCDVFYKDMRNIIPIQRLSDGSLLYDVTSRTSAHANGVYAHAGFNCRALHLQGDYRFTDSIENAPSGGSYRSYLDQQHTFSLSLRADLPRQWLIAIQSFYGSGFAYTQCILPEYDWDLGYDRDSKPIWEFQTNNPNAMTFPAYSRVDIAFRKKFFLPYGAIGLTMNFINVFNTIHTFAYIYTYDQDGTPIRRSETLFPFFPQVGLSYEF